MLGQYAEASQDVHHALSIAADTAAAAQWRGMGARTQAEARQYFIQSFRRRLGTFVAREYARFRLRRVPFIGAARALVAQRPRRGAGGIGGGGAGAGVRVQDFFAFQAHLPHLAAAD